MAHVSQPPLGGQASHPFLLDGLHARFVFLAELDEVLADLSAVAREATRPPTRRKLTRCEARQRYRKARAALAWLRTMTTRSAEPAAAPLCADEAARFERWAE
jgi:hypothetical protein